jgi:phage FluMu protein Com
MNSTINSIRRAVGLPPVEKTEVDNVDFYYDYIPSSLASGSSYMQDDGFFFHTGTVFHGIDNFINTNTNDSHKEWKCPACGTINSIEATVCGEKHNRAIGCGHPREKTRQEIYG